MYGVILDSDISYVSKSLDKINHIIQHFPDFHDLSVRFSVLPLLLIADPLLFRYNFE
jgi:hypothetical protein